MSRSPGRPSGTRRALGLVHRLAALVALAFSAATAVDYYGDAPRFCQAGAGCEVVHAWGALFRLDLVLPALGLGFYTAVLALSLSSKPGLRWLGRLASILGAVGALAFLVLQGTVIGAWCWLCLGVDSSAIVAGGAAALLLRGEDVEETTLRSPWWLGWVLAVGLPVAFGTSTPPSPLPSAVRARYQPGVVNVLVMSDPECPFCRAMHPLLEEAVSEARARGEEVHVERVLVPLPFHARARPAAKAILCVDEARREAMTTKVYEGRLEREALIAHARSLGVDEAEFERCLDAPETDARVEEGVAFARAAGMQGLPTTYVGERTILGFDRSKGAEPFREALEAATHDEAPTRTLWPFGVVVFALLAVGAWVRPRSS